jgi:type IV pilus biogenesis protein CpaD/CtpE
MISMRAVALLAALLAPSAAAAETATGSGALALAALVGHHSPLLAPKDQATLLQLLNGDEKLAAEPGKKITVHVDKVSCRSSNIEIVAYSCTLAFGDKQAALSGRVAHELYATLAEIGVPRDGAAGSVYEAVSNLACVIDPGEVAQNAGGGAQCAYTLPN